MGCNTCRQQALNLSWRKVRSQIERLFGDWKGNRSAARCRYVGLAKNRLHFTLLALAHNLRRWVMLCPK
ncbi:MAG: transposase [Sulfuricellaceae bacterium]